MDASIATRGRNAPGCRATLTMIIRLLLAQGAMGRFACVKVPMLIAATVLMASLAATAQEQGAATVETATAAASQAETAQPSHSGGGCFLHNRPAPACRFFGVTDFGVAFGRNRVTVPTPPALSSVAGDQSAVGSRVIGNSVSCGMSGHAMRSASHGS